MTKTLLAVIAAALLAAPAASNAAPFTIALAQDGVGDSGADWFGTYEVSGFEVTNISIVVDGTTYSNPFSVTYSSSGPLQGALFGFVLSAPPGSATIIPAVLLDVLGPSGGPYLWGFGSCSGQSCSGTSVAGSYRASPMEVPEPGTLALLSLGLAGFAMRTVRRRPAR